MWLIIAIPTAIMFVAIGVGIWADIKYRDGPF